MAQSPRIIRLESPSATQNAVNNMNDDIFMPMDGDYENAFGDGLKNLFKKKEKKEGDDKGDDSKGKTFWQGIFGTKEEREKKRETRRKNRAERRAARRLRKSNRQMQIELAAEKRALALGKSKEEAEALAQKEGAKRKAAEEKAIADAEEKAKANALANGSTPQVAEDLSNQAGEKKEQEIFGGYGTDGSDLKPSFWDSMSTGAKVGLIGGGVLVTGLIIWGIVASNKNK